MRLGTSIVLLALGAILTFALRVDVSGVDLQVVGWILMSSVPSASCSSWPSGVRARAVGSPTARATPPRPPAPRSGAAPPKRPTDPIRS